VSETLEGWLTVQSMWQYMEAVFSGGDIVKQLPQEAKRFANIDKNFMKVGGSCVGGLVGAGRCLFGGC
jgi:dynein heavy chain